MAKRLKPSERRQKRQAAKEIEQNQEREIRTPLKPLTERQKLYQQHLQRHEMTIALGPAGTGKTFVPAAMAAEMLVSGLVERVILCRPAKAVEQEEHGFLPGDLKRKMEPWTLPVMDAMRDKIGSQKVEAFVKSGAIETVPFAFMRGRTFKRSFVILDEAQNTSAEQMKLFVTRIGGGCRVAINGDTSQSDIVGTSGLGQALRMIHEHEIPCGVVEFTKADVVRSGLCQMWVEAYEKEAQQKRRAS